MLSIVSAAQRVVRALFLYEMCLHYFLLGGSYVDCPFFCARDQIRTRVHIYSISLTQRLWGRPHYRAPSLQRDLQNNLRNVAIPYTGIPLSWFACHRFVAYVFHTILYPLVCLVTALRFARTKWGGLADEFETFLLAPNDWCHLWQLNCRLAALHASKSGSPSYLLENKWEFLRAAKAQNFPVSPWLEMDEVVLKHKNEEGGLGVYMFRSAAAGGDWIIQKKLSNAAAIQKLLPDDAPLSSFRIVTGSRRNVPQSLRTQFLEFHGDITAQKLLDQEYFLVSCCFRAGRGGAKTDHKSIVFDVALELGKLGVANTNDQWYVLGVRGLQQLVQSRISKLSSPTSLLAVAADVDDGSTSESHGAAKQLFRHPDSGAVVTGTDLSAELAEMSEQALRMHRALLPDVPLCGWDVALTPNGMCFLEVNLSCNLFMASHHRRHFYSFIHDHFVALEY